MQGWISLYRRLTEHWLWLDNRPFDKRSAWVDLLLSANHKNAKVPLGNELIEVERGSFITSIRQLCDKWKWSNTKVIAFLELLENDGMILYKSDRKKTVITIVKYSDYQDLNDTKTTNKRHTNDTQTTQKHTNNNDNNENNDNKEKIYVMSQKQEQFINALKTVTNYPFDIEKDIAMYDRLEKRYPELDLIKAIEGWAIYKLDKPLAAKSNPRSQINTAFGKYAEWGKYGKGDKSEVNSGNHKGKPDYDKSKFLA